jgi:hypothetical protein
MKLTFLFLFAFLFSTLTFAQAPAWTWVRQIGGPGSEGNGGAGYDGGHTCATDAHGNVYITGHFNSGLLIFGQDSLSTHGIDDVFVVKFDSMGVAQWARSAGGGSYDQAYGVAVDTAGNVYIAGGFQSSHLFFDSLVYLNSSISGTYQDIFIAKYDANGNLLWVKTAGNSAYSDAARSIAVDPSGNAYITGPFGGTSIAFGSYTLTNNYFLTKYDTQGNVVWAKGAMTMGANAYSNSIDGNENIYVTGMFYPGFVVFENDTLHNDTTAGSADIFVVKYDSSGTVLWAKRAGGNRSDIPYCIYADSSGNAFVTGGSYSPSFNFGSTAFVNSGTGTTTDFYFLKFDPAGNEAWVQGAGGTQNEQGQSVTTDAAGDIYLTGYFSSGSILFGSTMLYNTTTYVNEIFVVKYSSSGNAIWAKQISGAGNDNGSSITTDPQGDVYTSGEFASSTISFGNYTFINTISSTSDMYFAKIAAPNLTTSLADLNNTYEAVIYPNPNDGVFFIRPDVQAATIEIVNMLGQKIYAGAVTDKNQQIDLRAYPAGIYFYSATTNQNSLITGKIIVR